MRRVGKMRGVAAVERALAVVGAFDDQHASLSLADIAAHTGLYKSTILRLIATLAEHGYMVQPDERTYRLGPMFGHLGGVYQRSFRLEDHVLPFLRHLVSATGESASFYIREGNKRLCLMRIDSPQWIRDHVPVGLLLPLGQGAAGKVLVSYANPAKANEKLPIATRGALTSDSAGLAAPVLGANNMLMGALTLSGPKIRFTRRALQTMGKELLDAALRLTAALGGNADLVKRNIRNIRR